MGSWARPALYDRTVIDAGVRHLFALVVDGLVAASAAFVTGDREEGADMGDTATRLWMSAAVARRASDARQADALRSLDDHAVNVTRRFAVLPPRKVAAP